MGRVAADDNSSAPGAIRYSVVRYPERFPEILKLRRAAYAADHKDAGYDSDDAVTGPRDLQATVVIAESAGRIIGSERLNPPISGPILYRNCRPEGPLHKLPPKSEFLEMSWGCIHPDHQGRGLFRSLSAHNLIAAEKFGRPYLLAGSSAKLWPFWRQCGYRKTGVTYRGAVTGIEHSVNLLDLAAVLAGRNIAPEFARVLLPLLAAARAAGSG